MLKEVNLKIGAFHNQNLLNDFNDTLNANFGNTSGTVSQVYSTEVDITSAQIVGTSAGQLGHAQGVVLVQAPGTDYVLELISATLIYDYSVAQYTGGGNTTINIGAGGAALTGLVSAGNGIGQSADKVIQFYPLSTQGVALTANTGINLVAASAFTQPGTAQGVIRVQINYRVHTLGLA